VAGLAILAATLVVLSRLDATATPRHLALLAVCAGVGLGLAMQVLVLAVQNSVPAADIGSASAPTHFARAVGGSPGAAARAAAGRARVGPRRQAGHMGGTSGWLGARGLAAGRAVLV